MKQLNLQEMVEVWKICKPYVQGEFEPYLLAENIYNISTKKSEKLFFLLYGISCSDIGDAIGTNIAISLGLVANKFDVFIQYMTRK